MSDDDDRPAPVSSLKARFEQLSRASSSAAVPSSSSTSAGASSVTPTAGSASSSPSPSAAPSAPPAAGLLGTRRDGSSSAASGGQLERTLSSGPLPAEGRSSACTATATASGAGSSSTSSPLKPPSAAPTPSSSPPRPAPSAMRKTPSTTWPPTPRALSPSPPPPPPATATPMTSGTPELAESAPARKKGPPPPIPSKPSSASLAPASAAAALSPAASRPPVPSSTKPSAAPQPPLPAPQGLGLTSTSAVEGGNGDGGEPEQTSVSALRSRFGGATLSSTRSGPPTPAGQPTAFLRPSLPASSSSHAPLTTSEPLAPSAPATPKPAGPPPIPNNRPPPAPSPAPAPTVAPPPPARRAPSTSALAPPLADSDPFATTLEADVEVLAPVERVRSPAPPPPPPLSRALRASQPREPSIEQEESEQMADEAAEASRKSAVKPPPAIPARPRTMSAAGVALSVVPPTPAASASTFLSPGPDGAPHPSLSVSPAPIKPPLPARKATTTPSSTPVAGDDDVVPGPPAPDLPARVSSALPTVNARPAAAPPPLPERSKTLSSVLSSADGVAADEPKYVPPPPPPPPTRGTAGVAREAKIPLRAVARSVSRVTASASTSRAGSSASSSDSGYVPPPPPPPPPPQRIDTLLRQPAQPAHAQDDEDDLQAGALDDSDDDGPPATGTGTPSSSTGGVHRAVSVSVRRVDEYPDPTLSNRRPPFLRHRPASIRHATGHSHTASFACADRFVAVGAHHLRVYDAESAGLELVCRLEQRETGLEIRSKEARVSALCFRPSAVEGETNRWLWAGTSEGHLFEVDVWSSIVTQTKAASHASATGGGSSSGAAGAEVTNIWTYAGQMFVLDDSGRSARYVPNDGGQFNLASPTQAARVADRQTFAALLGGQVWTATGPSSSHLSSASASRTGAKLPTIRVYEPFAAPAGSAAGSSADGGGGGAPAAAGAGGRVLAVPDSITGAVLCGTILPSRPDLVYLGHDGGQVSAWDRARGGAFIGVVKVAATAVTCLEGVGDRLWAGSRKGIVCVYDVETKPWTVTNMWAAHEKDTPVIGLMVDSTSIRNDYLKVYSWGRDDCVHAWDGLLEEDWIDQRLLERESEFCSYRDLKVISCSWNIDAAKPADLSSTTDNASFLANVLTSEERPDVVIFGFQEIIPLEDKKLAAKSFLFGMGKNSNTEMSDKVSQRYRLWHDKLVQAMRVSLPPDSPYTVVHAQNLVGLFTCIFVKNAEVVNLRDICITTVKRGMAGVLGNKGAIIARFVIDDSSLCFINCHLAAGQNQKMARNADLASILDEEARFPVAGLGRDELAYVGGGDGSMILDHDVCFLQGDLNYRIDLRRENVISSLRAGERAYLLEHDQLLKEMRNNPGFRLRTFSEAPIAFDPTYKYNRGTHDYDTSEKKRVPAWCDRILYRSRVPENVEALHYTRYEPTLSDHKPISAGFHVKVRRVRERERNALKAGLADEFVTAISGPILDAQHAFYTSL